MGCAGIRIRARERKVPCARLGEAGGTGVVHDGRGDCESVTGIILDHNQVCGTGPHEIPAGDGGKVVADSARDDDPARGDRVVAAEGDGVGTGVIEAEAVGGAAGGWGAACGDGGIV